MNKIERAAGYLRVSTAREGMSAPEMYRAEIQQYADAYSYKVELFEDIDFSGRTQSRPAFQKMIERRTDFKIVIVPKLSRFGRNMKQNLETYDLLERDGIGLAFLDLRADTTTGAGRLMRNMFTALAEYESDLIGERWKDTHRHLRSQGRPTGGTNTPHGYRYSKETKTYEVHEAEAEIVREIYDRYLQGDSIRSIGDDLNRRKVPTGQRGAKKWPHSSVALILENPAYAALLRHKDQAELLPGNWTPILSPEILQRAQALREVSKERVRKTRKPAQGAGVYLLSGLIVCGACQKNLHHRPASQHRPEVYMCPDMARGPGSCKGGSIQAQRAESAVWQAFTRRLRSASLETPNRRKKTEPDYEAQLAELDRQMQRLVDLASVADGPLTEKAFQQRAHDLEQQRETVLAEQRRTTVQSAEDAGQIKNMGRFLGDLTRAVPELWDTQLSEGEQLPADAERRYQSVLYMHASGVAQRRALLKSLIQRVRTIPGTRPKQVTIDWKD